MISKWFFHSLHLFSVLFFIMKQNIFKKRHQMYQDTIVFSRYWIFSAIGIFIFIRKWRSFIYVLKKRFYPTTPLNGACTVKRIFKDLGIQKWWKSDPLKGACTDTRISVHALLLDARLMDRYEICLDLGVDEWFKWSNRVQKGNKSLKHTHFSSKSVFFCPSFEYETFTITLEFF